MPVRSRGRSLSKEEISDQLIKKFWEHLERREGACWNWIGSLEEKRRRLLFRPDQAKRQNINPRRLSYAWFHGHCPAESWVLDRCGNYRCVNPEHLYLSQAKNPTPLYLSETVFIVTTDSSEKADRFMENLISRKSRVFSLDSKYLKIGHSPRLKNNYIIRLRHQVSREVSLTLLNDLLNQDFVKTILFSKQKALETVNFDDEKTRLVFKS